MNEISKALMNWIPNRLNADGNCRWLYLGDKKFAEPFFDQTISASMSLPENSQYIKCVSSAEVLPLWAEAIEHVEPTAIIFHISRCGSTLISQMLSLQPANIVLSEVPFFDDLLRSGKRNNNLEATQPLLKAAIAFYGTKRNQEHSRVFIKADSWHIHFYKELRALYPKIPFILLYRRPDEVLRSQQKHRGMQAVPGVIEPEVFGFDRAAIAELTLDEYMANVMESYLQAFINIMQHDKYASLVNYNEGGLEIVQRIAGISEMQISDAEWEAMRLRSGYHAKNPGDVFDEPALTEPAYPFLQRCFELYDQLEKIRITKKV